LLPKTPKPHKFKSLINRLDMNNTVSKNPDGTPINSVSSEPIET